MISIHGFLGNNNFLEEKALFFMRFEDMSTHCSAGFCGALLEMVFMLCHKLTFHFTAFHFVRT